MHTHTHTRTHTHTPSVKLPVLLAHTSLDERGMSHLTQCIHDMAKYLVRNAPHLFLNTYTSPSHEYIKAAAASP